MRRRLQLASLLFSCAAAQAATPTLVQSVNGSLSNITGTPSGQYSSYKLSLPNPAGAGNAIIVTVRDASGNGSTESIADNCASGCSGSNTYTQEKCETDSNTNRVCEFLALNVAAGTQFITINLSPSDDYLQAEAAEIYNVATSSALDGSANGNTGSGTGGSTTTMTAGSLGTLANSGDYIYMACEADSGVINFTWTAGSGQSNITWTGIDFNTIDGMAQEGGVYSSTTALNPQFKMLNASNATWACVAMALKSASAGTAPTAGAIHINNVQHISDCTGTDGSSCTTSPTSIIYQFPSAGNLLVLDYHTGVSAQIITGVTDSNSNSWSQICDVNGLQGAPSQRWYSKAATTGNALSITVTLNSNTQDGAAGAIYDISNASANPLDTGLGTAGCYSVTFNDSNAAPTSWTATTSLVTSNANELVITEGSNDYGTGGSTNSPNTFIAGYSAQPTEFLHYDQNNPLATCLAVTTTACETWTWNYVLNVGESGTAVGNLLFVASGFKQAGTGGPCTLTLRGAGPC